MSDTALAAARTAFDRILVEPTPADLWELQKALLVVDASPRHERARSRESSTGSFEAWRASRPRARPAAGAPCSAPRPSAASASARWPTAGGRAAGLLKGAVPALLEIGSAMKSAQAWEVEAGLIYDDVAWFLYDELWDVSATTRPELSPDERRDQIDLLWTRCSTQGGPTTIGRPWW